MKPRFSIVGLSLVLLAVPFWVLICVEASMSTGFGGGNGRYIIPPFVLCGLTLAIQRLVRPLKNSWSLSILFAGVGALAVLMWAAG
jgi:hypothetical protein